MLQTYGWHPDARTGLGAAGKGILHPVKVREKRDRAGIDVERDDMDSKSRRKKPEPERPVQRLDAGKIKQLEVEARKRDQRLRDMFYGNDEVEKYLGHG